MECSLVHWYEEKTDEGKLANTVVLGRVKRFQAVSHAQRPAYWMRPGLSACAEGVPVRPIRPHEGSAREAEGGFSSWRSDVSGLLARADWASRLTQTLR